MVLLKQEEGLMADMYTDTYTPLELFPYLDLEKLTYFHPVCVGRHTQAQQICTVYFYQSRFILNFGLVTCPVSDDFQR